MLLLLKSLDFAHSNIEALPVSEEPIRRDGRRCEREAQGGVGSEGIKTLLLPSHPPLISVGKLFQRRKVEEMRARKAAKNNTPRTEPAVRLSPIDRKLNLLGCKGLSTPNTSKATVPSSAQNVEDILGDVESLLGNVSISTAKKEPSADAQKNVAPVSIPSFVDRPAPTLISTTIPTISIAPVASESYAKETQTDAYVPEAGEEEDDDLVDNVATSTEIAEPVSPTKAEEDEAVVAVEELSAAMQKEIMGSQDFQVRAYAQQLLRKC